MSVIFTLKKRILNLKERKRKKEKKRRKRSKKKIIKEINKNKENTV